MKKWDARHSFSKYRESDAPCGWERPSSLEAALLALGIGLTSNGWLRNDSLFHVDPDVVGGCEINICYFG